MAFRVFFAIATFYNLDIDQMEVKRAFLYGFINQLVYIEISKGTKINGNWNIVCKLLKALHNLKQFLCLWYKRLSNFLLQKLGLSQLNAYQSIFVKKTGLNGLMISTFVNDIRIIALKGSEII